MVTPKTTLLAPPPVLPATAGPQAVTSHTFSLTTRAFALSYTFRREEPGTNRSAPARSAQAPPNTKAAKPITVQGPHEVRRRQQLARLLCPPVTEAAPAPGPLAEPAPSLPAGPACRAYQQAGSTPVRGTRLFKI